MAHAVPRSVIGLEGYAGRCATVAVNDHANPGPFKQT